jgi:hypothetical protein
VNASVFDRFLALAPLGVLAYVLRRHDSERRDLLRVLETDREAFRSERRELINRVQFPTRMPVVATAPWPAPMNGVSDAEVVRARWASVGHAALPTDADDVPGDA